MYIVQHTCCHIHNAQSHKWQVSKHPLYWQPMLGRIPAGNVHANNGTFLQLMPKQSSCKQWQNIYSQQHNTEYFSAWLHWCFIKATEAEFHCWKVQRLVQSTFQSHQYLYRTFLAATRGWQPGMPTCLAHCAGFAADRAAPQCQRPETSSTLTMSKLAKKVKHETWI